jgi:hypothetical protein
MNGAEDEYREHATAVVAFLVLLFVGVLMIRVGHQVVGTLLAALGLLMLAVVLIRVFQTPP